MHYIFPPFRSSALPFIQRGCYNHVQGRNKGKAYNLLDIHVVCPYSCYILEVIANQKIYQQNNDLTQT